MYSQGLRYIKGAYIFDWFLFSIDKPTRVSQEDLDLKSISNFIRDGCHLPDLTMVEGFLMMSDDT